MLRNQNCSLDSIREELNNYQHHLIKEIFRHKSFTMDVLRIEARKALATEKNYPGLNQPEHRDLTLLLKKYAVLLDLLSIIDANQSDEINKLALGIAIYCCNKPNYSRILKTPRNDWDPIIPAGERLIESLEAKIPPPAPSVILTLCTVAMNGELCALLSKSHLDFNAINKQGETPLIIAVRNGHVETVRVLLEKKNCSG